MEKNRKRLKLWSNYLNLTCFMFVNLAVTSQINNNYRLYYRPSKHDNLDSIPFVQAAFENKLFSFEHVMDSVEYTSFKISQDTLYLPHFPYPNQYLNQNEFGYYIIMETSIENENIIFLVYNYENGSKRRLKYRVLK